MEPNITNISKKVWKIVRVAIYMIKKGLCKRKLLMDLNLMMKRGKLASKSLINLMLHHHHNHHDDEFSTVGLTTPTHHPNDDSTKEYEFSCSDTPVYRHYFTNKLKKINRHQKKNPVYLPSPYKEDVENVNGVGFKCNPRVRQVRITDSPYPMQNSEEDKHVDQEAETFIYKFYSQLKQQKYD